MGAFLGGNSSVSLQTKQFLFKLFSKLFAKMQIDHRIDAGVQPAEKEEVVQQMIVDPDQIKSHELLVNVNRQPAGCEAQVDGEK